MPTKLAIPDICPSLLQRSTQFLLTCLTLLSGAPLLAQNLQHETRAELPTAVQTALQQAKIDEANFSVYVKSASGNQILLDKASASPRNPASAMKMLTTIIGLDELGPNYRWKTQILSTDTIKAGKLSGNLYLRGGAEPNLNLEKLTSLLRQLRTQGLSLILGDIVLDRSFFNPARPDAGVADFDEYPDAYYNVIPDALLLNNNLLQLNLDSDAQQTQITIGTPLRKIKIENHLQLNDLACQQWEKQWLKPEVSYDQQQIPTLRLQGSVPRNCKAQTRVNVLERDIYWQQVLAQLWSELGGSWRGQIKLGVTPPQARLLAESQSDTLAEVMRQINKSSDNTQARLLYLSLGAEAAKAEARLERDKNPPSANEKNNADKAKTDSHFVLAEQKVRAWLARHQIDDQGLVLENGSGLSRTERISAQQLSAILQAGWQSLWAPELLASMPIAALDGTMRKRLKSGPAEFRARIKTGTLNEACAIAGFVYDAQNQPWIVVAMINQDKAARGRAALDELINWVAAYPNTTMQAQSQTKANPELMPNKR